MEQGDRDSYSYTALENERTRDLIEDAARLSFVAGKKEIKQIIVEEVEPEEVVGIPEVERESFKVKIATVHSMSNYNPISAENPNKKLEIYDGIRGGASWQNKNLALGIHGSVFLSGLDNFNIRDFSLYPYGRVNRDNFSLTLRGDFTKEGSLKRDILSAKASIWKPLGLGGLGSFVDDVHINAKL